MLNLQQVRSDTPACEQVIHLNNAGASLPPQIVTQTMLDYLHQEAEIGAYEMAALHMGRTEAFYHAVARLLNTNPENIAFVSNATDAYAKALSAIPFENGDVIITSRDDYVSNQLAFLQLVDRFGVQLIRVPNRADGPIDISITEELIRLHRPKVVALTQVPTNSGLIQPVKELGEICQQYDCWYLVDACQSAGQMVIDVTKIQCDFLCTSYRKFLRGPRGAGFLYVSDKALHAGLCPLGIDLRGANWDQPESYSVLPNARRFEYWERSYALLIGSLVATEYLLDLGVDNVTKRLQRIGTYTREQLMGLSGITLLDKGPNLANIITFTLADKSQEAITTALKSYNINFSFTSKEVALLDFTEKNVDWAVRISPHYYNTEQEISQLVEALVMD